MAESILINDVRQGRNGFDPPHSVPPNQVCEAVNVDWYGATLARRRGGAVSVSLTGGTSPGSVNRLFRHQPAGVEGDAELWAFSQPSSTILPKVLKAGTSWADVTGGSLITAGTLPAVETTTLDGKLWIAAKSATGSRLMVYDPSHPSGAQIRYVGFTTTYQTGTPYDFSYGNTQIAIPTFANTGAGTYAAVGRNYRVRFIQKNGSLIVRRSEYGRWGGFVPSGGGTAVRVTCPALLNEGETHWELEVTYDTSFVGLSGGTGTGTWYRIATTAVATTTYDDSYTRTDVAGFPVSQDLGENTPWPNVRYIISDGNRLIGGGSHITGEKGSRIYFSPVMGATDQGDLERVPVNDVHENFIDLNENDGGVITGLVKSMNGAFYVFKRRQIWRVTPTGDDVSPYTPKLLTTSYGAISQASIVSGRDFFGNPAVYFWSEEGPCRIITTSDGSTTIQYLGEDIRDLTTQIDFSGYNQSYPFAVYYPAKHQVWFWFYYGSTIRAKVVFDIMNASIQEGEHIRGGWSVHSQFSSSTTVSTGAGCATIFAKTLGATMSSDLVPYTGDSATALLLKADTTDTTDNATNFQAYITSRPLDIMPFGDNVGVGVCNVLADPASGVSLRLSLIRDYGLETRTSTVSLTAAASETKVIRKFEDAEVAGAGTIQFQLGDAAAVAATQWKAHALALSVYPQEPR